MNWLTLARYGIPAAIAAFLIWATIDRFDKARTVALFERCEKAAGTPADPLPCPKAIAERIDAARRGVECETALAAADLYAIRATCGAQVKRAVADRDAARADLKAAARQLAEQRADSLQAIARAEARATQFADRKADNERTIDAAPRGADGSVLCDAECVSRLAGDAPGARR